MATRFVWEGDNAGEPVVVPCRGAKVLAGWWASMGDYLPGEAPSQGFARLDPPVGGEGPRLVFLEPSMLEGEPPAPPQLCLEADHLDADVAVLEGFGAVVVSRSPAVGSVEMKDPEGNPFRVIKREDGRQP